MEECFLSRHSYHPFCTMGWLKVREHKLATMECPWKDNRKRISCIPEGDYTVTPHSSVKFPNCWEITNVPDRSKILIHAGNTVNDIEGCICVGLDPSTISLMVLRSIAAMNLLREIIGIHNSFKLHIDYKKG